MLQAMEQMQKKGYIESSISQMPIAPSESLDCFLKIPYINEGFSGKVSTTVKKAGTNAKIVTQAGRSVKSLISERTTETCECELCKPEKGCSTSALSTCLIVTSVATSASGPQEDR